MPSPLSALTAALILIVLLPFSSVAMSTAAADANGDLASLLRTKVAQAIYHETYPTLDNHTVIRLIPHAHHKPTPALPPDDVKPVKLHRHYHTYNASEQDAIVGNGLGPMADFGGLIIPTITVRPIFWGPSWTTDTTDIIPGLTNFYSILSGSSYLNVIAQYMRGRRPTVELDAGVIDPSTPPETFASIGDHQSATLTAVCNTIATQGWGEHAGVFYPVYTEFGRYGDYCGIHWAGTCPGSTTIIFYASIFNLTGDAGCSPGLSLGGQSQGLTNMAKVSAHELFETMTDPRSSAWLTSHTVGGGGHEEVADVCNFVYFAVILADGSLWNLQGFWDNTSNTCASQVSLPCCATSSEPAVCWSRSSKGKHYSATQCPKQVCIAQPSCHCC